MNHEEAVDLVKRYYAISFRKGYIVAKGRQKTLRFRGTCETEQRLRKQIVDALATTTGVPVEDLQELLELNSLE